MKTFNLLLLADIISIVPLVIILSLMYNFFIAPGKNVVDIILAIVIILANFSVEKIKRLPWPKEWDSVTRRPKEPRIRIIYPGMDRLNLEHLVCHRDI